MSGRGIAAGTFEIAKFQALETLLSEGDVFWDVGAHYGYASILGARSVGASGTVISFEPSHLNRWFLETHLTWNSASQARVLPFALAEADGEERFGGTGSSIALKLGQGDTKVTVRSLSSLVREGLPRPTVLKIDIEGAEDRALRGARADLEAMPLDDLPSIMCAVHNPEQFQLCRHALKELGYHVVGARWFGEHLSGATRWRGDPDILAIPPMRSEKIREMLDTDLFRGGPVL